VKSYCTSAICKAAVLFLETKKNFIFHSVKYQNAAFKKTAKNIKITGDLSARL
jgi:hypothetical protein